MAEGSTTGDVYSLGINITMMSARHSSREKIAALSLALVLLCANVARAQGSNPDPPTNPQVGNVTSTSAILSWAQGSPGVKFEVIVSPGNISFTNLNSTSLELSSLGASTTYSWQVRSTKGNKSSDWVQGPGFTTSAAPTSPPPPPPPSEAPAPPMDLQVSNVGSGSATLSWSGGGPGVKFELQVSPGGISDQHAGSPHAVSSLAASTTYSWQLRSTKGNKSSDWVQGPGFTTSAAPTPPPPPPPPSEAPAPPMDLQVSNVGSGSATLSWSGGGPGVKFELQVSPGGISDQHASSPYAVSSLAASTAYSWQVRSTKGNKSSDWVQGSGFTTSAAPTLPPPPPPPSEAPAPPTDLQVSNVGSGSATLSWSGGGPGVKFELQVSPGGISDQHASSPYAVSSFAASTAYSWQVRSTKGNKSSDWVQGPGFTTSAAPTPPPPSETPAPPTDLQVSNVGSGSATLSWSGGGPGVKFELQVSPGNISDEHASSPYAVSSLLANTTYSWQVRSTKGNKSSDWVQGPGFATSAAPTLPAAPAIPAAPALISPENASGNVSTSPTLSWSSSAGATSYELQFSTKQNFAPGQTQSITAIGTSAAVGGLKNQTTYYWRVSASNGAGVSGWSGSWSFMTEAPRLSIAAAPALTSPADGAPGVRTSVTLSWNASKGATSYQVQVSFKENFPPGQTQEVTTGEASTTVSGLKNQTTYYWRVSASNEAGVSGWSGSWRFTTEALPLMAPAVPSLVSPADGAPGVSTSAMLSWDTSVGASSYWLQVSTKDNFAPGQTQEVTTNSTFATVIGLSYGTTYYWRVSASNGSARSGWSSVRSFVTFAAVMTDAEVSEAFPREFKLSQNYPNPFNPSTTIQFSIPRTSHVKIRIYNALGHVVHNLVDESLPPGTHARQWAASQLPSGVYFCRIQAGGFVDTKRLVLMK